MGAVLHAKRTGEASTPEVADAAANMKTSDVKDFASTKHKNLPEKKLKKEGTNRCPEGQYYCFDMCKCRPIPKGHKVKEDGELVKEAKKFSDLSTQRKPGENKKPKKKREGFIFDVSQPPSKKVRTESLSSFRKKASDAMKRVAGKKKGDGDTKYKYPTGGGPYVDAGAEAADRIKKKGQVKAGILPDQIGTARKDDR